MCISTFTETEAETTELVLRVHKGDIGQEKEEWEMGISLTHSAQCSVHGQPHLDTNVQRSLEDNGVPCVVSRGRVP